VMRRILKALSVAVVAVTSVVSCADAAFVGFPKSLRLHIDRIGFDTPTLAPMALTRFCLKYTDDCEVRRMAFRPKPFRLTEERWSQLVTVNREINRQITPQRNEGGVLTEEWLVSPKYGDCNDYAVTKRHELLARGWPSRTLLLSEVVTSWGEHHLVLVVRTSEGDVVLDNLNANVYPVSRARYEWVRAQSPGNPKFWSTVQFAAPIRTAMLDR
jgi:predicted transglutaminase-like cysteine proteinase